MFIIILFYCILFIYEQASDKMASDEEISVSEIPEFYAERDVFITGATGFMGKASNCFIIQVQIPF